MFLRSKSLLLLLNELLLQLIITDLKCNFLLKFSQKDTHTHAHAEDVPEMMHLGNMRSTKWKSERCAWAQHASTLNHGIKWAFWINLCTCDCHLYSTDTMSICCIQRENSFISFNSFTILVSLMAQRVVIFCENMNLSHEYATQRKWISFQTGRSTLRY